jgi:hypothetical protein
MLDPAKLRLFLLFVVPGFVAFSTYRLFVPSKDQKLSDVIVSLVSYSMINLGLWLPLLVLDPIRPYLERPLVVWIMGVIALFASPAVLAFLVFRLRTSVFFRRFALDPSPKPWDFFFSKRRRCWFLCHLKSGLTIGGYYGADSAASAYPAPEEIYLEEVWSVDAATGRFLARVDQTAGTIVRRADCVSLEFFSEE